MEGKWKGKGEEKGRVYPLAATSGYARPVAL